MKVYKSVTATQSVSFVPIPADYYLYKQRQNHNPDKIKYARQKSVLTFARDSQRSTT